MIRRVSLLIALLALLLPAAPVRANDPNYMQTVFIHVRGLTSEYIGEIRLTYTHDGRRETKDKRAMAQLPARFVLPSMAEDVEVEGKFSRNGVASPSVTVTQRYKHLSDNVTLDFSGKVKN